MKYHGGKNGSGVYQRLISMMPPHRLYVEAFLGSGAVLRRKRPAERSLAFETDRKTIAEFIRHVPSESFVVDPEDANWKPSDPLPHCGETSIIFRPPSDLWASNLEIKNEDAVDGLRKQFLANSYFYGFNDPGDVLIYADPPYPREVRKQKARVYQHEMLEESEHEELLDVLLSIPARVMISSYDNPLYNSMLKGWRKETIATTNRAGSRVIETVYLNFPEPFELHDYRYLGEGHRERMRIKRKAGRWIEGLRKMPPKERYAIVGLIGELRDEMVAVEKERDRKLFNKTARAASRKVKSAVTPDPASAAEQIEIV